VKGLKRENGRLKQVLAHETPSVLEKAVAAFADHYNHRRHGGHH
jgi:hypothetical protein